jgi:methionyl aminopeptidase
MKKYQGAFIKNEREIACLREANRMVANILDAIGDIVKPGERPCALKNWRATCAPIIK